MSARKCGTLERSDQHHGADDSDALPLI